MSKNLKITNKREGYAFPNVPILVNHDYSGKGTLGNMDKFILHGKAYALEPGYIQHKDGSIELIEISLTPIKAEVDNGLKANVAIIDEGQYMPQKKDAFAVVKNVTCD